MVAAGGGRVRFSGDSQTAVLLLFDIDGTLLTGASETVRDAMHTALREHHGVDAATVPRRFATAGRTDSEIIRAILLDLGIAVEQIDELADDVRASCYETCARLYPDDLSYTLLPGVRELLEWLSGLENITVALLTGNFEPVARLKLARAGIGTFFAAGQGAFGSDAEDRTALQPLPGAVRARSRPRIRVSGRSSSATLRWTSNARAPTAYVASPSPPGRTRSTSYALPPPWCRMRSSFAPGWAAPWGSVGTWIGYVIPRNVTSWKWFRAEPFRAARRATTPRMRKSGSSMRQ